MENLILKDGSRLFHRIECMSLSLKLETMLTSIKGLKVVDCLDDSINPLWINFIYQNQPFSVNEIDKQYHFIADSPDTTDVLLLQLIKQLSANSSAHKPIKNVPKKKEFRFYYLPIINLFISMIGVILFPLLAIAMVVELFNGKSIGEEFAGLVLVVVILFIILRHNILSLKNEWKIVTFSDSLAINWPLMRRSVELPLNTIIDFEVDKLVTSSISTRMRVFIFDFQKEIYVRVMIAGKEQRLLLASYFFNGEFYLNKLLKLKKHIYHRR